MYNNNTTTIDTDENNVTLGQVIIMFKMLVITFTLASLSYGVLSWCIFKRFRNFKNFVYLNAIASCLLRVITNVVLSTGIVIVPSLSENKFVYASYYSFMYFTFLAPNYWVLVICYIFYNEVVKVFEVHITRRFLKSFLIGWVAPLVLTILFFIIYFVMLAIGAMEELFTAHYYLMITHLMFPLFINLCLYIKLVYTLYKTRLAANPSQNKWQHFYIATLVFVLSDILVLSQPIIPHDKIQYLNIIKVLIAFSQTIILDIVLPLFNSNRLLWREFFAN